MRIHADTEYPFIIQSAWMASSGSRTFNLDLGGSFRNHKPVTIQELLEYEVSFTYMLVLTARDK